MKGNITPNETFGTKIINWIDLNKLYKTKNIIALHDV